MQQTPTEVRDGLLAVIVTQSDSTSVVSIAGELDMANVKTLAAQIESCEAAELGQIVIDLDALEFIDSTGLALLVNAHHRLNQNGSECLQMVPSRALVVRRVMETTGLDQMLPFRNGAGGQA